MSWKWMKNYEAAYDARLKVEGKEMRKVGILFSLSYLILILIGCSTHIQTKSYVKPSGKTDETHGIAYYLPMKFLKVTVKRNAVPTDIVQQTAAAAEKARVAATTAKTEATTAQEAADLADEVVKKVGSDGTAAAKEKAALLRAAAQIAKEKYGEADKKEKIAVAAANTAAAGPKAIEYKDDIVITELPAVPDTRRLYVAHLDHSIFAEDDLKITTTPEGLLKSVGVISTDKTPEIILDTAKVAIAAFKVAAGIPPTMPGDLEAAPSPPCELKQTFTYEKVVDPDQPTNTDLTKLNEDLRNLCTSFQVGITKIISQDLQPLQPENLHFPVTGLIYRRPIPYLIELREGLTASSSYAKETKLLMLPNGGPVAELSLQTGRFVTTTYNVEFNDGFLTRGDVNRPSEALGFVQIPLNVLREVIALPTELLQLKIDYSSKQAELLKSMKDKFDAQEALRKAIEERDKVRTQPIEETQTAPLD